MSEIYALSEAVRSVRLVSFVCSEMGAKITLPLCVQVDNKQAISFKEGTCLNSKIRGVVDMREGWVRELRELEGVDVRHVPGTRQLADVLTKGLPNYKYRMGLKLIRGDSHRQHMREVVELAHAVVRRGGAANSRKH